VATRFAFGKNWQRYLRAVDQERIDLAIEHLAPLGDISGLSFCDVGCGSGLFSLAAYRLGAVVRSFDYDEQSVMAAQEMQRRFAPRHWGCAVGPISSGPEDQPDWTITQGDALDEALLDSLGTFDVVYSWGVLHHTGDMRRALDNVTRLVKPGGRLWVAIYDDQGVRTRRWTTVKRLYNEHPWLRPFLLAGSVVRLWGPSIVKNGLRGHPFASLTNRGRGMSAWTDLVDWVGGWPYEVMTPQELEDFFVVRGFSVEWRQPGGCNQVILRKPVAGR
jgi:2-polyprenyl-3-methyl-5-hydroxy-6-metoxy-1,4-benzoquinol methylase